MSKFEYSYQECEACENCISVKRSASIPTMMIYYCEAIEELLRLGRFWRCKETCKKFKPKQQQENKMLDTTTPGALVGKEVKCYGEKYMVIGDDRLFSGLALGVLPILIKKEGKSLQWVSISQISEWIEPKAKKLVAPYYFKGLTNNLLSDSCLTKEEAEKQRGFIAWCEALAIEIEAE